MTTLKKLVRDLNMVHKASQMIKAVSFQMCKQNQVSQFNTIKSGMWFLQYQLHRKTCQKNIQGEDSLLHHLKEKGKQTKRR